MTRRGPPLPIGLQLVGMAAGIALSVGVVVGCISGVGERHPLVGVALALYLGLPAAMLPLAAAVAIWQKKHPGCFDEVDARDALMESSEA